ncbi:MAG: 30S ribosomal protein S9 [Cyanobacteriota/Melainabacteria group bacterium]
MSIKPAKCNSILRNRSKKDLTARVRLVPGTGNVTINGRTVEDYCGGRFGLDKMIMQESLSALLKRWEDSMCISSSMAAASSVRWVQFGTVCSRPAETAPQNRPLLRVDGLLTRDSRVKERKYGRKKARKRFQFSKR